MKPGDAPVECGHAMLLAITHKGVKVRMLSGGKERVDWLPQSGIHEDSEVYGIDSRGEKQPIETTGKLILKRWLVNKRAQEKRP